MVLGHDVRRIGITRIGQQVDGVSQRCREDAAAITEERLVDQLRLGGRAGEEDDSATAAGIVLERLDFGGIEWRNVDQPD